MRYSNKNVWQGLGLALLLLIFVAGCDTTGGEETIFLNQGAADEVQLEFEFSPGDHSTGSTLTLTAHPVLQNGPGLGAQIAAYLDEEGAGAVPSDLLDAELARAELVLGLPPGEQWNFAESVILQLRAGGDVTEIAQSTDLPDAGVVQLDVLDRNLTSILRQSNPELSLRLTPNSFMQGEPTYTIRARLRFRFEVPL